MQATPPPSSTKVNQSKPRKGKKRPHPTSIGSEDVAAHEARRQSHNIAEKRRRDKINEKLRQLEGMLPTEEDSYPVNNKAAILQKAINYIRHLEQLYTTVWEQNMILMEENRQLKGYRYYAVQGRPGEKGAATPSETVAMPLAVSPFGSNSSTPPIQTGKINGDSASTPSAPEISFATSSPATSSGKEGESPANSDRTVHIPHPSRSGATWHLSNSQRRVSLGGYYPTPNAGTPIPISPATYPAAPTFSAHGANVLSPMGPSGNLSSGGVNSITESVSNSQPTSPNGTPNRNNSPSFAPQVPLQVSGPPTSVPPKQNFVFPNAASPLIPTPRSLPSSDALDSDINKRTPFNNELSEINNNEQ